MYYLLLGLCILSGAHCIWKFRGLVNMKLGEKGKFHNISIVNYSIVAIFYVFMSTWYSALLLGF